MFYSELALFGSDRDFWGEYYIAPPELRPSVVPLFSEDITSRELLLSVVPLFRENIIPPESLQVL